jgi:hypothetical protein
MSEEEKKILLQKYNEEGEGEGEDEEEEEEEGDEEGVGEEEGEEVEGEEGEKEDEGEREGEGEEGEGEGEGERGVVEEEDSNNDCDNDDKENDTIVNSKMILENENILLKRINENNLKNLKKTNTVLSNNENEKNIPVKITETKIGENSQKTDFSGMMKKDEINSTDLPQNPVQRQYGNKKKFVITSPEKNEEMEIGENQQTGQHSCYKFDVCFSLLLTSHCHYFRYLQEYNIS